MDQWGHSAHHQAVLQNLGKDDRQKTVRMWGQGLAFSSCSIHPSCLQNPALCPWQQKAGLPSHKPKAKAPPSCLPTQLSLPSLLLGLFGQRLPQVTLNVHVHHDHGFHALVGNPDDSWVAGGWWRGCSWWGSSFS